MRNIRIATLQAATQYSEKPTITGTLAETVENVKLLSSYNVDILCLSEAFTCSGMGAIEPRFAEGIDGPTLSATCSLAAQKRIAIVCPILERDGRQCFNTAFFVDRSGNILGKYRKIHPTELELKEGIFPGPEEATVIEWEGLKIGMQICFDANWPEDWIKLKRAGAEIIFFCSAFSAGKLLESYATLLRTPVVAATWCPHCRIYDRCGRIIAHQSPYYPYAIADVQIKQPLFHLDFQTDKVETIRRQYSDVSVDIHNGEGTWSITGNNLDSIIGEHQLVDVDDYLCRAEKAQKQCKYFQNG